MKQNFVQFYEFMHLGNTTESVWKNDKKKSVKVWEKILRKKWEPCIDICFLVPYRNPAKIRSL